MKLEKEVAALDNILARGVAHLNTRFGGLALPFTKELTSEGAIVENRFVADASPACIDEQYDVDIFHIGFGAEFTPPEIPRGRTKQQVEKYILVLIGYTNRPGLLDYVKHHLAKAPKVELRKLELAPDLINQKYLFLGSQPNADLAPRQLFAITYALAGELPLGGDSCPKFDL